jgi:hypothetical protein
VAAFAIRVAEGMAISEINVRAAMNILMTHLHVAEHCQLRLDRCASLDAILSVLRETESA